MKPLLAITMGDPTGIGPEIIAEPGRHDIVHAPSRMVVLGHAVIMQRAVELVGSPATVVPGNDLRQCVSSPTRLPCLNCCSDDVLELAAGQIASAGGEAAYQCIDAPVTWPNRAKWRRW